MNKYKILFMLFAIGVVFTSCEPNKALYEELDNEAKEYSKKEAYTLTLADYKTISEHAEEVSTTAAVDTSGDVASSINTLLSLNSTYKAEDYIPAILTSYFRGLGNGSSCIVTYNNFADDSYGDIDAYTLSSSDHTNAPGLPNDQAYYSFAYTPESYLLSFVSKKYEDIEIALGTYKLITFRFNGKSTYDSRLVLYTTVEGRDKWTFAENTLAISSNDYIAMAGKDSKLGFVPGTKVSSYLSEFAQNNMHYTNEGDEAAVAFYFKDDKTKGYVAKLHYEEGLWKTGTTSQFLNKEGVWLFDPTVHYDITPADYQYLVDYVKDSPDLGEVYFQEGYPNDREFYFGANSKYVNFNVIPFYRPQYDPNGELEGLSDEEIGAIILERINEGILLIAAERFPYALPVINGIPVYYQMNYLTYGSGNKSYYVNLLCTDIGTFELQEGQPTVVE